jgi:hypothetical protein
MMLTCCSSVALVGSVFNIGELGCVGFSCFGLGLGFWLPFCLPALIAFGFDSCFLAA